MSEGLEPTDRPRLLQIAGIVDVDTYKGTIDLGNGWALQDVSLVGKGSIIWLDLGDGAKSVDYEAMALRDAAIDATLN